LTELDLANPFFSAPVYHTEETSSTMEDAARLAGEDKASGFVVMTDFQTAGRGRIAERHWESPRGKNLLFTLALKGRDIPFGPAALSLRCGLGLAILLETRWGLEPRIKWPNDLLVKGGKIAGILCQGRGDWFFAGIGLNLASPSSSLALRRQPASIREVSGVEEKPSLVLTALLPALKEALSRPDWQEQINRRLFGAGSPVTVHAGAAGSGESFCTRVVGVAPDGGLILMDDAGRRVSLFAGELDFGDLT
jgi:BirA family biotin operon repressor/biotin-[acetyl-CoA-carboxylase] ligase